MNLLDFTKLSKDLNTASKRASNKKTKQSVYSKVKGANSGGINTHEIVIALAKHFSNLKVIINNCFLFSDSYESDFVVLYDSGYLHEIEVKKTKSDFNEDFHKKDKHQMLKERKEADHKKMANRFSYACPKGMLTESDIPEYAGWIEVDIVNGEFVCTVMKDAPLLHKHNVYKDVKDRVFRKLAWRYRMLLQGSFEMVFVDQEKKDLVD